MKKKKIIFAFMAMLTMLSSVQQPLLASGHHKHSSSSSSSSEESTLSEIDKTVKKIECTVNATNNTINTLDSTVWSINNTVNAIDETVNEIEEIVIETDGTVNTILETITGTPTITPPKLTIVLVTDGLPYNQMRYLQPNLTGGLGTLINNGIVYTNANYPRGNPTQGTGCAAYSTGALGQVHGIPNNQWFPGGQEEFVASDYGALAGQSLLYVANTSNGNPPGQTYPLTFYESFGEGTSNRSLLADTLADQMVYYSPPETTRQFYYVAMAGPESATSYLPAGQLGKPFAFDITAGGFTSSQAFYPSAIVTITGGGGTGATATAVVVDGVITDIVVSNPGTGYTSTPTVTITDVTTAIGVGLSAPTVVPVTYNGQVIGIEGPGTGAAATATVVAGQVAAITLSNGGTGYSGGLPDWVVDWNNAQNYNLKTSWTHNLIYPASSPAYDLPNINNYSAATASSIIGVPQPIVQSGVPLSRTNGFGAAALATQTNGVITGLTLVSGGSGYPASSTIPISILGITYKGVLASATATTNAGGVVTSLTLISGGSGYTNPVVAIPGTSNHSTPFSTYTSSPDAIGDAFSFVEAILDNNLSSTDELVIFVNIAGVEQITEGTYGLFALDTVDQVYQLDQAFASFMLQVYDRIDPSQVLWGWISSAGAAGVLPYWQQAGDANANGITATSIRTAINSAVNTATSGAIPVLIPSNAYMGATNIWFGPQYFTATSANQAIALSTAQSTLLAIPGIKNVYTQQQLLSTFFQDEEEDMYLKLELFPVRSGQLIYSTQPLVSGVAGTNAFGDALTMWEQNYHVPLILYQQGQFANKTIVEPVFINQLPITLAQILNVPRPSGAPRVWGPLPGIFTFSVN